MSNLGDDLLFAEERKAKITEYINENKKATVNELSEYFKVCISTIRNDLKDLETLGKITRTHGGAITKSKSSQELDLEKRNENIEAKKIIAKKALELIDDGDTIILDSGTTIHELAKLMHSKKDLTIITNDLTCVNILEPYGFNIILLGGIVSNGFHWVSGEYTLKMLEKLNADKVFLSAGGFSINRGISIGSLPMSYIKEVMIKCSAKSILMSDISKYEKYKLAKFADFKDIDIFITDKIDNDVKAAIEELGGEVILA